jgi:hypothetical protein
MTRTDLVSWLSKRIPLRSGDGSDVPLPLLLFLILVHFLPVLELSPTGSLALREAIVFLRVGSIRS